MKTKPNEANSFLFGILRKSTGGLTAELQGLHSECFVRMMCEMGEQPLTVLLLRVKVSLDSDF